MHNTPPGVLHRRAVCYRLAKGPEPLRIRPPGSAYPLHYIGVERERMKNTKKNTKGTPTDLNISVLAEAAAGRLDFPNATPAASAPHLRRCLKAGLVEVAGRTLHITTAGVAAIVAYNERFAGGYLAALPVPVAS